MNYLLHLLITIGLYAILAMSLNLIVGYAGLTSLCHAAFSGIGAYATSLLMVKVGIGFLPSLVLAMTLASLLSILIAVPATRMRGDLFVLATLGFQVIVFSVLYNWTSLTNGSYGLSGIPVANVLGFSINSRPRFLVLLGLLGGLCALLMRRIVHSPFGRVLRALREDEHAANALGKNVPVFKLTAFALGASGAALAGGLAAIYTRYVDPTSFTLMDSIFLLSIVVIGGAGSLTGPVTGAVLMLLIPESLRFFAVPVAIAANVRQIIYGLLLIVLMRMRPRGIHGEYDFS